MNYSDFSNPKGSYSNSSPTYRTQTTPKKIGYQSNSGANNYLTSTPTYLSQTTPPKEKDSYTELSAIFHGVGNYHINHFASFFKLEKEISLEQLQSHFYNKFCTVFESSNISKASLLRAKYQNNPLVKFTIGGTKGNTRHKIIGSFHDDCVYMRKSADSKSFYGTTLKRDYFDIKDKLLIDVFRKANVPVTNDIILDLNQHHFLAGRRSWRIDYNQDLQLYYLETAALERSSGQFMKLIEYLSEYKIPNLGSGSIRNDIIDLWSNLLMNYLNMPNIIPVDVSLTKNSSLIPFSYKLSNISNGGTEDYRYVVFKVDESEIFEGAVKSDWFNKIILRHPGLVNDL
jgi:hypothetical protein